MVLRAYCSLVVAGVLGCARAPASDALPVAPTTEDAAVASPFAPAEVAVPGTIAEQNNSLQHIRSWADATLRSLYDNLIVDAQDLHKFGLKPQPHVRDLINADYWRLDVRLLYGFDRRYEGEAEFNHYFPSPGRGADRAGISQMKGKLRYRWTPDADPTGNATTGLELVYPFSSAPDGLTDGVNRYSAYCSYARVSTRFKNTQEFVNLAYTMVTPSAAVGTISPDLPQDDFTTVAVGLLHNRGAFTYGLSATWDHVVAGRITNFVTVTPSIMWDVPPRFTRWTPGTWQVGTAFVAKRLDGRNELDVKIRVRWLIKVKEVFRDWKRPRNSAPVAAAGW